MSATLGTFDSQFMAENSMLRVEKEKKIKLKNALSAENETGRNHQKLSFLFLCVCLSHVGIVPKWLNVGSCKQCHMIAHGF